MVDFEFAGCAVCSSQVALVEKGTRKAGALFFCTHEHVLDYAEQFGLKAVSKMEDDRLAKVEKELAELKKLLSAKDASG